MIYKSNGRLLVEGDNKDLCKTCCGFGSDCCCFIDPTPDAWSSTTTYIIDDLVAYSWGTYRSLQNNNLNHRPSDAVWWTQISSRNCGNEDWNKYSPYGGPGKTPKYLTIEFSGIVYQDIGFCGWPSTPNRKFLLTQSGAGCYWIGGTEPANCLSCEGDSWRVELGLRTHLYLYHAGGPAFFDCIYTFFLGLDWGCSLGNRGYLVGDALYGTNGLYYRCILGHEKSDDKKPITGGSWETYWECIGCSKEGRDAPFGKLFEKTLNNAFDFDAEIDCDMSGEWGGGTCYVECGDTT